MSRRRPPGRPLPAAVRLLAGLAAAALAAGAAPSGLAPAADLAAAAGDLPGWAPDGPPRQFGPDNLWEHIDGAAEQYLAFGCRALTVARFRQPEGPGELRLEIYEHAGPLAAFGIYAVERPAGGPFLALGSGGHQRGGNLDFHAGPYYLKIEARPAGEAGEQAARQLAQLLAARLPAGPAEPPEFAPFPRAGLIDGSFALLGRNALGVEGLDEVLAGRYAGSAGELSLHLARRADPAAAAAALAGLRQALARRADSPPVGVELAGAEGFAIDHRYIGPVLALRQGPELVIVTGAGTDAARRDLAAALIARL